MPGSQAHVETDTALLRARVGIDVSTLPVSTMWKYEAWMERRSLAFAPAAARYFKRQNAEAKKR